MLITKETDAQPKTTESQTKIAAGAQNQTEKEQKEKKSKEKPTRKRTNTR